MKTVHEQLELIRRCIDGTASAEDRDALQDHLRRDASVRRLYARYANVDATLGGGGIALKEPVLAAKSTRTAWLSWRPIAAAAAGLAIGMFGTSVVFGFVAQRAGPVKMVPLKVFDPGVENAEAIMAQGVPDGVGQWGGDSAKIVAAENGVQPREGQRMMRLEPIPREKNVKNLASRVYQVLDLHSMPERGVSSDAEVQVTGAFFATKSEISSRYLIRAIALDEPPEQATTDFWSKMESDGVVSESQRFDTVPGNRGWQTFSLKLRLPLESKTLVFIFGAVPPENTSMQASVHYLDDVHVSLLSPETKLP